MCLGWGVEGWEGIGWEGVLVSQVQEAGVLRTRRYIAWHERAESLLDF